MKKIILLVLCTALIISGCKKESPSSPTDNWDSYYGYTPDRFPIQTNEGFGYINKTGNTVISPNALPLIYAAGFSYGKAWVVNSDTLIGYIDESGNWAINPNPNYYFCGNFSKEGFAPVEDYTGQFGFINTSGVIQYCSYDTVYDFHNGLAPVVSNGLFGLIDITNTPVIPLLYVKPPYPTYFNEGYVFVMDSTYKWKLLDKNGNTILGANYDDTWLFTENVAPVSVNSIWKYIKPDGNEAFPQQFDLAYPFFEGCAAVEEGSSFGFIDKTGNYIVRPEFDEAWWFSEGLAVVRSGNYYHYIDKNFNSNGYKISTNFLDAYDFQGEVALVQIDANNWAYINNSGKILYEWQPPVSDKSATINKSAITKKVATTNKKFSIRKKQTVRERLRARLLKGE
jgi:hypothetical protein